MIKRFIGWFILVPICAILIVFALANRQKVTLNFDPTTSLNPIIANIEISLFVIIYAMLFIGIVLGGTAVWFTQGRFRKACRQLTKETTRLEAELEEVKKTTVQKNQHLNDNSLLSAQDLLE